MLHCQLPLYDAGSLQSGAIRQIAEGGLSDSARSLCYACSESGRCGANGSRARDDFSCDGGVPHFVQFEAVPGRRLYTATSRSWREEAHSSDATMVGADSQSLSSVSAGMGRAGAGGGVPHGHRDWREWIFRS